MLIAEQIFLLLTAPGGGRVAAGGQRALAVEAAVLAELMLRGRITTDSGPDLRTTVCDATPTGDDILDAMTVRVAEQSRARLVTFLRVRGTHPEREVAQRLHAAGVIVARPPRLLGLVPAAYPVLDPAPAAAARARLARVLGGTRPTPPDAVLLALLRATRADRKVLRAEAAAVGLDGRARCRRIDAAIGDQAPAIAARHIVELVNIGDNAGTIT